MPATEQQSEYLTVRELADLLGVSLRTAYTLVTSGEVPAVKVRSLWRVPRAALEQQLSMREEHPAQIATATAGPKEVNPPAA